MSTRALSRRLALLLLLIAVAIAFSVFNSGRANVAEPPAQTPAERLAAALSSKVELNFKRTPLSDVARSLQEKHGIQIHIDEKAFTDANVALDTPITFQIQGISLRSALRLLLRDLDLKMLPKESLLWITTKDVHDDVCEPRVYEVLDLVQKPGADPSNVWQYDFDSLINLIQNGIRPDAWNTNGGPGAIEKLPNAGAIVASVNPEIQEYIAELLSILRRSRDQQFAEGNVKSLAQRSFASVGMNPTTVAGIRKALAQRIDLDVDRDSLDGALAKVLKQVKIPARLDVKALNDASVRLDEPTSLKLKSCSLAEGLEILLRPQELQWTIVDEVLLITTKDVADDMSAARVYPVSDFTDAEWRLGNAAAAYPLKDALQNSIDPASWGPHGGPGNLEFHPQTRSLVVVHTEQVQQEIERMLVSLRQSRQRQLPPQPVDSPARPNDDTLHVKVYWIPTSLDPQPIFGGIKMGGMSGSFSVRDPDARSQNLAPPEQGAAAQLPRHVVAQFPSAQLKPHIPPHHGLTGDLARIIPQVIEPESWKDAGGKGVIEHVQNRLIVRQTNRVHAQIAKLLREL